MIIWLSFVHPIIPVLVFLVFLMVFLGSPYDHKVIFCSPNSYSFECLVFDPPWIFSSSGQLWSNLLPALLMAFGTRSIASRVGRLWFGSVLGWVGLIFDWITKINISIKWKENDIPLCGFLCPRSSCLWALLCGFVETGRSGSAVDDHISWLGVSGLNANCIIAPILYI